jgi:hypothetical protein
MPRSRRPRRKAPTVLAPIPGPDSFANLSDPHHVHSQAATLLLIGSSLRGDLAAPHPTFAALGPTPAIGAKRIPEEDLQSLGFPAVRVSGERFRAAELRQLSGSRPIAKAARTAPARVSNAAEAFYKEPAPTTAAALLASCLRHPQQLVRVAAAASYLEIAVNPTPALRTLESGLGSRNLLVRDVAAYALARADPKNPKLAKVLRARRKISRRRPSRTSTIIHGTWASGESWWQPPNGDFWSYLQANVDQSLYGAQDRFSWSGGYSDTARALAGTELHNWVQSKNLGGLDLYTHSHGGSVAMLANQAGTDVGQMVLLSCPVHWPKYSPDFNHTQKIVSVRVHLDLVILADGGGQRFEDPRIAENVLPLWFDHFATHDPANWQKFDIPAML